MTDNSGGDLYIPNVVRLDEKRDSPEARLFTIQADIQNAINQGYGVEETIKSYRAAGFSFTDSKVRDIYHQVKGEIISDISKGTFPGRDLTLDATIDDMQRAFLTWKSNDRYADVIRLSVYDIERGESKEILFRYYHSNEDITVGEIIQLAMDTYNELDDPNLQYYVAMSGSVVENYRSQVFA